MSTLETKVRKALSMLWDIHFRNALGRSFLRDGLSSDRLRYKQILKCFKESVIGERVNVKLGLQFFEYAIICSLEK